MALTTGRGQGCFGTGGIRMYVRQRTEVFSVGLRSAGEVETRRASHERGKMRRISPCFFRRSDDMRTTLGPSRF
jgi:hypothetical protein